MANELVSIERLAKFKEKTDELYAKKEELGGYLPLSGGTLTGALETPSSAKASEDSTYGINLHGSDVVGTNSIVMAQSATADGWSGLVFPHAGVSAPNDASSFTTDNMDRFWMKDGVGYLNNGEIMTTDNLPTCADINAIGAVQSSGFWGMTTPNGSTEAYIKTTELGILPYANVAETATEGATLGLPAYQFYTLYSRKVFANNVDVGAKLEELEDTISGLNAGTGKDLNFDDLEITNDDFSATDLSANIALILGKMTMGQNLTQYTDTNAFANFSTSVNTYLGGTVGAYTTTISGYIDMNVPSMIIIQPNNGRSVFRFSYDSSLLFLGNSNQYTVYNNLTQLGLEATCTPTELATALPTYSTIILTVNANTHTGLELPYTYGSLTLEKLGANHCFFTFKISGNHSANPLVWYAHYHTSSGWSGWKTNPTLYNINGYWGLGGVNDTTFLRTPKNGLIPYQSTATGISSSLGTATWQFNDIYGKNIYANGLNVYNEITSLKTTSVNGKTTVANAINGVLGTSLSSSTSYADMANYITNYMTSSENMTTVAETISFNATMKSLSIGSVTTTTGGKYVASFSQDALNNVKKMCLASQSQMISKLKITASSGASTLEVLKISKETYSITAKTETMTMGYIEFTTNNEGITYIFPEPVKISFLSIYSYDSQSLNLKFGYETE